MITRKTIAAAKPGTVLKDTQVKGLGLYINSQSVSWKYCYRVRGSSVQRRPKIGSYPAMDLTKAREVAMVMSVEAMQGKDPSVKEDSITLEALYDEFVRAYTGKRKPTTMRTYQNMWDNHIPRSLKRSDIRNIKRHQVARLCNGIRGHIGNRVLALISRLYSFAQQGDYCGAELNPARGVERAPERARERVASRDELRRIGRGIAVLRTSIHPMQRQFADLLTLIIITGARLSEWKDAETAWVDYDKKLLRLPDSKTGSKTIALPDAALDICKARSQDKYIFENPLTGKPLVQVGKNWSMFKEQFDLGDLRIHDLRRSYASYALNSGVNLNTISKLLGHSNVLVTDKVYAKLDTDTRQEAAEIAAQQMSKLVG